MAQTVIYRLSLAEGIVCNAAYLEKPQTPCSVHWHCKIESAGLRSKQWHILLPRSTNWSFLSLKALWLLPQTCWCLYACLYVCVIVPHLRRLFWGSSITLQRSIFLPKLDSISPIHKQPVYSFFFAPDGSCFIFEACCWLIRRQLFSTLFWPLWTGSMQSAPSAVEIVSYPYSHGCKTQESLRPISPQSTQFRRV